MDRSLIETYVAGPAKLRAAVAGLTREDLTARPGPGAWSILEVVVHIADSDAISIDRMKRMLSEDNPPLLYADETVYVQRLHTHDQDIEDALTLLEVGRRQWARVLRLLPDESFSRSGQHNRRGTVTVAGYVAGYIDHIDDHLKFIEGKRTTSASRYPAVEKLRQAADRATVHQPPRVMFQGQQMPPCSGPRRNIPTTWSQAARSRGSAPTAGR